MLNQDLPQPKEGETKEVPIIKDRELCSKVIDFLDKMTVILVDSVDAEVKMGSENQPEIPTKFETVLVEGKGLNIRVGVDRDEDIAWDIHFGIRGKNSRKAAEAEGITVYETFQTMIDDLGNLKTVVQNNPQIEPRMIVSRTTNGTMFDFAKRIGIIKGVLPSEYRFEGDQGEMDPLVFDKDRLFDLMYKVDKNVSYRDNLKVILGK